MLCVIFDLDGTLIDSEPLCSQAFIDLLPGLDDSVEALMRRYRGHRMADVLADLSRRLGHPLDEEFNGRYQAHLATLYDTRLAPMPGVAEALEHLERPMCVASNGPGAKMRQGLKVAGLDGFFGAYGIRTRSLCRRGRQRRGCRRRARCGNAGHPVPARGQWRAPTHSTGFDPAFQ